MEALEIKVARIHKLETEHTSVKAFVDITINDCLLLKGIKVVYGSQGLYVNMPQEKARDGKWYDTIKFLDSETLENVRSTVLNTYCQN